VNRKVILFLDEGRYGYSNIESVIETDFIKLKIGSERIQPLRRLV
jgi:hypothetical protein